MWTWVAIAITVPLLALGGVTRATLLVALAVTASCALWLRFGATTKRARGGAASTASIALWLMAAVPLVQLLPVPNALLRILSPQAAAAWGSTDAAFSASSSWHPISLDPPGTTFMLATAVGIACFFDGASHAATAREARRRISLGIGVAVLAFDGVALLHSLFGLERLYGLYAPHDFGSHGPAFLTPLLNANHAAAVACVAPPLLLGLLTDSSSLTERISYGAGAALSGAVAILTLSRGGMCVLAFELAAMAALSVAQKRGERRGSRGIVLGAALTGAVSVGAALYVALPMVLREAGDRSYSKLEVPRAAARMIRGFWLTGCGRGAFTTVFPAYQGELAPASRFTHVESWPIQLVVDMGLVVSIAVAALLGYALVRTSFRAIAQPVTRGALVALVGLGLHDLADFSMEFIGVGVIAAALLALVTSCGSASTPPDSRSQKHASGLRWLSPRGAALAVAFALATADLGHDVDDEAATLARAWSTGKLGESFASIRDSALRHPAEPYFAMLRGVQLLSSPEAGAHLARAIRLGPGRPQTHFWLGRWFASLGRQGQAWAEYRTAVRLDRGLTVPVLMEMIRVHAPVDDLVALSSEPWSLEGAALELARLGREDDAQALDVRILMRDPAAAGARLREIERDRAGGRAAQALRRARALVQELPREPRAYLTLARIEPDTVTAETVLVEGLRHCEADPLLLEHLVRRRGGRLGLEAVSAELQQLREVLAASGEGPERAHVAEAEAEIARGRPGFAVPHLLDAAATATHPEPYLERAASLAEESQQLGVAESIWRRLAEREPANTRYKDGLERLRRASFDRVMRPDATSTP